MSIAFNVYINYSFYRAMLRCVQRGYATVQYVVCPSVRDIQVHVITSVGILRK